MVGRLERAGFVRRGDDPGDRRKVIVELTDQAREVLDRIWGPIAADLQAIAARFTIAELETLERLFDASAGLNARHMERVAELDLILPRERRDG